MIDTPGISTMLSHAFTFFFSFKMFKALISVQVYELMGVTDLKLILRFRNSFSAVSSELNASRSDETRCSRRACVQLWLCVWVICEAGVGVDADLVEGQSFDSLRLNNSRGSSQT